LNTLSFAIIGHLVGDYLLQSDWMAEGKKRSSGICAIHCALWTGSVMALAGWWAWWVGPTLFITHFAQDRTQVILWFMRVTGKAGFATGPMAPWSIVAVDNSFHLLTLAIVARFV
jgi:hypothetical protein